MNVHVPIGFGKKGGLVFWEMIKDFLFNLDKVKILNPVAKIVAKPIYQPKNFGLDDAAKS